jgi:VWFA-related protein
VLANASPGVTIQIGHVDTTRAPEVHVLVSVLDAAGNPVSQLNQSDVQISEDGAPRTVSDVSPATDSMAIVLAIDTSGSMGQGAAGHQPIDQARLAAEGFVNYIKDVDGRPGAGADQLAVVSFNDKPSILAGLSTDHNAAINAIRGIKAEQKWTSLYDAAYESVKIAAASQSGQRAVVLLTDGWDEGPGGNPGSVVTFDDVVVLARQENVPIYTVGLGGQVDQKTLARLATLTSGSFSATSDPAGLSPLFQHIATQLKSKFMIAFETGAPAGEHTIQVAVRSNGAEAADKRIATYPAVPPVIQIVAPKSGSVVQDSVDVIPGVGKYNQNPIVKVEYRLDGQLVQTVDSPPFIYHLTPLDLPAGTVVLEAKAFDSSGLTGADKITITLAPPSTVSPTPLPAAAPAETTPAPTVTSVQTTMATPVVATPTVAPPSSPPATSDPPLLAGAAGVGGLAIVALGLGIVQWRRRAGRDGREDEVVETGRSGTPTVSFASLTIVAGPDQVGRVYYLPADRVQLGRDGSAPDIVLADPTNQVSRAHAVITREGADFLIQDLGSLNGTMVNGVPIVAGESIRLTNGLEIQIANTYRLRFDAGAAGEAVTSRTRPIDPGDSAA